MGTRPIISPTKMTHHLDIGFLIKIVSMFASGYTSRRFFREKSLNVLEVVYSFEIEPIDFIRGNQNLPINILRAYRMK